MNRWLIPALALTLAACGGGGNNQQNDAVGTTDTVADKDLGGTPDVSVMPPDVACLPTCAGRVCGDDGCGGSCGNCFTPEGAIDNELCRPNGTCCIPSCVGMACGDNGCGGVCGECGGNEKCTNGQCVAVCQPDCGGKECGDDGCGASCGNCPGGEACNDSGICEPTGCVPDCDGKECGYDGCTGNCGSCGGGETCQAGQCVECEPDCAGKQCGSDGCGGQCGSCVDDAECDQGSCVCVEGFDWSPDETACWPVCPELAGNDPDSGECECDEGYHWNGDETACFVDCVEGAENDPLSGECVCLEGTEWNPDQTECWPDCPDQAEWTPEAGTCVCEAGLSYDPDLFECVTPPIVCGLGGAPYPVPEAFLGEARFGRTITSTNMEPVILDKSTGLMWMGCDAGLDGYTCTEGLLSLKKPTSAVSFCENSDWGGFEDWRLPTIVDLLVLTDNTLSQQYGASSFFWYFDKIKVGDTWWSSDKPDYTTCPQECFLALSRDDPAEYGTEWFIQYAYASFGRRVRCVRDPSPPLTHCAEVLPNGGEPVVYFEQANRFWQGCPAGKSGAECGTGSTSTMPQAEAVTYCEELSWGGFDDWTLPDINHFLATVDFGAADEPLLDAAIFPGTGSPSFWSSTLASEAGQGWVFDYQAGQVVMTGVELPWSVRCTRTCPGNFAGTDCLACAVGWEGDGCDVPVSCESEPCYEGVDCTNIFGVGFECGACPAGMAGDGIVCEEVDGCADAPCFEGVECFDVPAPDTGYSCGDCPQDMYGDGENCLPVLPCEQAGDCGVHGDCTDVGDGVLSCVCHAGFDWDGAQCIGLPGGFASGFLVPTASWPWDVVAADFDENGTMDLAWVGVISDTFQVASCNGNQVCTLTENKTTWDKPRGIVTGHFDGDTHLDIAIAQESSDSVAIHHGLGTGLFTGGAMLGTGNAPRCLTAADVNGDFADDLLVGLDGIGGVTVILGVDNGGFEAGYSIDSGGYGHWEIETADVNEDGKLDLVLPDGTGDAVKVMLGDGTGLFAEPIVLTGVDGAFGVAAADLDGDDHVDLVGGANQSGKVVVFLGDGEGNFDLGASFFAGDGVRDVVAADFNGDDVPDLAVSAWGDDLVRVYYGLGDGTFDEPLDLIKIGDDFLAGPGLMSTADMNGNGHPDLIVVLQNKNAIAVLEN